MRLAIMYGLIGLANFAVGNLFVGFACVGCQLVCAVTSVIDDTEGDDSGE